ncbi:MULTISPECIES: class II 3-deoxy-7-phosphoheptulonate synthase [unclassified Tessaracoccus]|uniref:class II 3-deoxy-7-phosphoheptulonate synthase n=1 Tax=unclassified Tessaracoccus TaxID=2635419 RepID=UPI00096FC42B|nr:MULTISPECIES: 3-deoxy-7-phosphoheptulonate synthase class II [unclassified Tessaracoccus]MBB1508879.1 3-deoxy-7-phosphoheptulonate synthase class II [Tessaracoccus sp. MC1756]MCG6566152.1 3-deoxy-7-phosphoheptulonate synthase class II [Tessaracoccus sp. ZS01]OMG58645.1 3-deoxy-7-phosphoheptulonate synthase [Tessaracoccus sp. ZS01]
MSSIISREELRALPYVQQPSYPDPAALDRTIDALEKLPPLVFAGECDDLRLKMADVADGRAFLLQGGDCAETFSGVTAQAIKSKLLVQLSMAVVMTYAAQVPVVKVGRIAGQYAKPRSNGVETRGDLSLPSYRGDAINGFDFTQESREHDPQRLLRVYNASAATLNLVRAFVKGGFADLRGVHSWNAEFVRDSQVEAEYEELASEIDRALAFMVACGVKDDSLSTVDFYASHEALLLEYERALTRVDSRSQELYGCSGHMLWIGERTRQLDGAHVELFSRVQNPLGVKLGPSTSVADALALADKLDPHHVPGRLTFITRMGAKKVRDVLPAVIEAVEASGRKVAWVCDPMHGNTFEAKNGYKTRSFADVADEVNGFFDVHEQLGTWPGGLHVEMTGDDVTECVGGVYNLDENDLANRYETVCDPRLNRNQSLELAFLVARRLRSGRLNRENPVQWFQAKDL